MTTIAFKAGVLAGDSLATDNQKWKCTKVHRLKTEAGRLLVGYCGEVYAAHVFMDWLKDTENSRKPEISSEDFEAIVVSESGCVTLWNQSLSPWRPEGDFFAIGSGALAAMAAMECGKSAVQAVKIACKYDPFTGGPVRSLKL